MAITKKEFTRIRGVVREEIHGAVKDLVKREEMHGEVENLARIVAKAFEQVNKQFEQVNKQFEQVNKQFETVDKRLGRLEMEASHTNARLSVIERDIAEIRKHFVYRDEFEGLMARVALLEKKVGAKSGK